jgi:hypothetical protein
MFITPLSSYVDDVVIITFKLNMIYLDSTIGLSNRVGFLDTFLTSVRKTRKPDQLDRFSSVAPQAPCIERTSKTARRN